jgi:hypothetical protein
MSEKHCVNCQQNVLPKQGVCPACRQYKNLQCHHIFPARIQDKKCPLANDTVITLCNRCHAQIEKLLGSTPTFHRCINMLCWILQGNGDVKC